MDAIERIDKFLKVTAHLAAVVRQENQLLAAHKTRGLADLVEEKKKLGVAYEQHIKALQEPGALDGVDGPSRQRLQDAIESFTGVLDENRTRVQATLEASHRMFDLIIEAARDQQAAAAGYGQSGSMGGDVSKAYKPALSVGLNQEY